jgi:hypothetical protein
MRVTCEILIEASEDTDLAMLIPVGQKYYMMYAHRRDRSVHHRCLNCLYGIWMLVQSNFKIITVVVAAEREMLSLCVECNYLEFYLVP